MKTLTIIAVLALGACATPTSSQDAADSGQGGATAMAPVVYNTINLGHGAVTVSGSASPAPAAAPSATQSTEQGAENDADATADVDATVPVADGGGGAVDLLGNE